MQIDTAQLRSVVQLAFGRQPPDLSAREAEAIVGIAYLAMEIDFDEDPEELADFEVLKRQVCVLARIDPSDIGPVSPLPIDHEEHAARIRQLASRLSWQPSRELAYVLAYLIIVSDLELDPIESEFLDELQRALDIDDDRASRLAEAAAELVTPPPDDARMET
ncbi:MAG: hypothetical protein JWO36_2583 [Myxococcales bacterium]|nr:hypothetical protein [Myxococcales bacterium]